MVDATILARIRDTPAPRVFGNVSPLDPQLFSRINDFADDLLSGSRSGKYSPIEVAQWLEDHAATAAQELAGREIPGPRQETARISAGSQSMSRSKAGWVVSSLRNSEAECFTGSMRSPMTVCH